MDKQQPHNVLPHRLIIAVFPLDVQLDDQMPSFNFTTSKGTHNETYIELQINFCCRVLDSVSLKKLIMCVCVCVCGSS